MIDLYLTKGKVVNGTPRERGDKVNLPKNRARKYLLRGWASESQVEPVGKAKAKAEAKAAAKAEADALARQNAELRKGIAALEARLAALEKAEGQAASAKDGKK